MENYQDPTPPQGYKTFQEFLDKQQYSKNGILRYEKIFGENFVSTGGIETTQEFVKMLALKPGQYVLDVGCGIGGSAFYMAENHGVKVMAIDLSTNMIDIATERCTGRTIQNIKFEIADATKKEYQSDTYDVIYSRDTILHIDDKRTLFEKFLKWLKPGGKLLVSDYCCSEGTWSETFSEYVKQRGYHLLSVAHYGKVLQEVGFINIRAEDRTDMFMAVLKKELEKTENGKQEFIKEFNQRDFDEIVKGWSKKIYRCRNGDQKWGLFYAEKSTS